MLQDRVRQRDGFWHPWRDRPADLPNPRSWESSMSRLLIEFTDGSAVEYRRKPEEGA